MTKNPKHNMERSKGNGQKGKLRGCKKDGRMWQVFITDPLDCEGEADAPLGELSFKCEQRTVPQM